MLTSSIGLAALDGGWVALSEPDLADLSRLVQGHVLLPGDPGWQESVALWNAMAATAPAVVVRPGTAAEVAAAVRFARERGVLLSVKGGGHNIAGTALAAGALTLDLSRMRDVVVDVDRRLAHVGPGCRLREVDQATQQHGLATVLGFVSDTGVAGLTLGGGLGYLTRRFGWAVDNLESVEIVTADGAVRTASRDDGSELFWAVRGAGANVGVVTRFTFRLHEVGPVVVGGLVAWPFERADEVLHTYRAITRTAPRELTVFQMLLNAPPAPFVPAEWHGRPLCAMAVCCTAEPARADELVAPVRELGQPVVDLLGPRPYLQVQSYLDDTEPPGNHYYWKTEFLADLDDAVLSGVRDAFRCCPVPDGDIGILHLGGALNERAPDDGAVGNRDARYALGIKAMWPPGDPHEDRYRQWVRDSWQRVRPFSTGATYINFQTADEGADRVAATYGSNLARLAAVKKAYDPANLFRVNRNVAPAP